MVTETVQDTLPGSSGFLYKLLKALVTSILFYGFRKLFSVITPIKFWYQQDIS